MEFDLPTIINMVWAAVAATLLGFAVGPVRKFFGKTDDSKWIILAKTVITDVVDALDQAIAQGNATNASAKAMAVNRAQAALTASRSESQIVKATGMSSRELAETEVEATVNRKRALEKAAEAGSLTVGPR